MRRFLLILLTAIATLSAVAGGASAWRWLSGASDVYTDGSFIRERVGSAPVRSVLWIRAAPIDDLNSSQDDFEPTVSADGATMVFVRASPGGAGDLYTAQRQPDGGWSEPVPLEALNSDRDELGPSLSPDGSRLYFYSDRAEGRGGYDLWVSHRTEDGWSAPANLGEAINTRYHEAGAALTPDGRQLYFASNRPQVAPEFEELAGELHGGDVYNIYVAPITAGGIGAARLVPELSSAGNDSSPAVSPAGDFIYFSSDRPGGLGGLDVYRARLFRGQPQQVENLGSAINSPYDDLNPTLDLGGFGIRFTSDRPEGALAEGETLDYDLYHSVSREVVRKRDVHAAIAAVIKSLPALMEQAPSLLVWIVLLLLALALLFVIGKFTTDEAWARRWRRLSLLTKCVLLSVVAHALLFGGLAVWRVHTVMTDMLGPSPAKVKIVSREVGSDLARQVRSGLTSVTVEAAAASTPRHEAQLEPIRSTEASLDVLHRELPAERPTEVPAAVDAAPTDALQRPVRVETASADPTAVREPEAPAPQRSSETAVAVAPGEAPAESAPLTEMTAPATELAAAPETVERPAEAIRFNPDAADAAPETAAATPSLAAAPASTPSSVAVPAAAEAQRAEEAALEAGAALVSPARAAAPAPEATEVGVAEMAPGSAADPAPTALNADSPREIAAVTADHIAITEGAGPAELRGVAEPRAATAESASEVELALAPGDASSVRATGVDPAGAEVAEANLAPVDASEPVRPLAGAPAPRDAEATGPAPAAIAAAPDVRAGADVRLPAAAAQAPSGEAELAAGAMAVESARAPEDVESAEASVAQIAPTEASESPGPAVALAPGAAPEAAPELAPLNLAMPDAPAEFVPNVALPEAEQRTVEADDPGAELVEPEIAAADVDAMRAAAAVDSAAEASTPMLDPEASAAAEPALAAGVLLPDIALPDVPDLREPDALGDVPIPGAVTMDLRLPEVTEPVVTLYEHRDEKARRELVDRGGGSPETESAVAAALDWLARHQEASGAWNGRTFDRHRVGGVATYDFETALTGLSLMCFLGADHTHMEPGPYRDNVQRALNWMVAAQGPDGDLRGGSTMYNHGIAAIALCEAYGMTGDPRLRDPAQRAIRFIERAQDQRRGGWRYEPQQSGDTSVLGWQVMALVSAKRAELEVSDGVLEAAGTWLDSASRRSSPGLYAYQPRMAPTVSMTAEGMFTRQLLGEDPQSARMIESAAYITREMPKWHGDQTTYAWYYATMALYQHGGEKWNDWNEQLSRALVERQRRDGAAAGSWDPMDRWSRIGGRIYQTAICTLTLEVYYRYLPGYLNGE